MNIVKIELKDNNKTVAININGFTKFQRAKIKKQLNDIFVVKNDIIQPEWWNRDADKRKRVCREENGKIIGGSQSIFCKW